MGARAKLVLRYESGKKPATLDIMHAAVREY